MTRKFYSAHDLVELGLVKSRFSAYRAVKRGDLPPPMKVAGRYLWTAEAINNLVKEKTHD